MLFITVPSKAFLFIITNFSLFFHSFSENIRHERNNEDGNIHKKLENKNMPTEEENYFEVGEVTSEGTFTHYEYVEPPKQKPSKTFIKICNFVKNISIKIKEKIKAKKGGID